MLVVEIYLKFLIKTIINIKKNIYQDIEIKFKNLTFKNMISNVSIEAIISSLCVMGTICGVTFGAI